MTVIDMELYKRLSHLKLGERRGEKIADLIVTVIDSLDDPERIEVIEHLYERFFTNYFEDGELD